MAHDWQSDMFCKRYWPYKANTTGYVVCRINVVLMGDCLKQYNAMGTKSGSRVTRMVLQSYKKM